MSVRNCLEKRKLPLLMLFFASPFREQASCCLNFAIDNSDTESQMPALAGHTATFDFERDQLVVVGGYTGEDRLSDVFVANRVSKAINDEDYSSWTKGSHVSLPSRL